ncbi:acyltransferase [Streptomyces sp. ITFR-16]|uniref:acyltransferase family protein n=1 Tax=Streptomyces sp. ITFR-16 TaxID=3075198 RepID=UPI00288C1213|nr:acyltransferase [Streptomyces sp. ITFR-16]WNI24500.1 acyltransferase [Streptomyces sp. ITFR-16]
MTYPNQPPVRPQQPYRPQQPQQPYRSHPPQQPYAEPHTVPFPVRQQVREPEPRPAPEPVAEPAAKKPGRDRYLDLLRSIALVRVVVYHIFGWAWLTVLFPSMGVMFALAGSLMARSLARPAWTVIKGRIRRLLPPMWAFSAVVVPMMFWLTWKPVKEEGIWWFIKLGCYIFPVGAPPYPWASGDKAGLLEDTWAVQAAGPLWYIRAYLWFVLASPLLLKAFRRLPWATMLAPIGLTAVIGSGLVTIPGETGNALVDFAMFGSCWILGFAHNDGLFDKVPRYLAVSLSAIVMAFGLWWASGHLTADGWDLNDIPLAQATWSFGFCVILLQYAPSWQRLPGRLAAWDPLVTLANNRAVTIYLWHNLLIMATIPILDELWEIPFVDAHLGSEIEAAYTVLMFLLVWPLIGIMIVAVGWLEDVAAKRRPRLWPNGVARTPRARR